MAFILYAAPSIAQDEYHNPKPFGLWVSEFKQQAKEQGISDSLLERAFKDMQPLDQVIRLDRKQPEGTKTFTDYLAGAVNTRRINEGRALYQEHQKLLQEVSARYGVQPQIIVSLWGIETNYGGYTGNIETINALATLAYDGRRSEFFTKELIHALHIIEQGHIGLHDMQGSWAGALGQCQFMPSSFLKLAVDYDGDGRKDIWNSLPDVFGSIANYLRESGWNDTYGWGVEVKLPGILDPALTDGSQYHPIAYWRELGVTLADGSPLPDDAQQATITLPGDDYEAAYLIYSNYDVLLKWNRSRYFATAVGTLADEIVR